MSTKNLIRILGFVCVIVAMIINITFSYNQEHIICNNEKCVIEHVALPSRKVVKTEDFDIKNIKNFEAQYNKGYYYLHANYKDGTNKRISPVYIAGYSGGRYKQYIDIPVEYLNKAIKKKKLNIDLYFPEDSYFPEYGY